VLVIEPFTFVTGNEKLTSICVGTAICHGKHARFIVAMTETFIFKDLAFIDGIRASTITFQKITTLDHKIFDHAMECTLLVADRSLSLTMLARTELSKVFGGIRAFIGKQFHYDSASVVSTNCHVEKRNWIRGVFLIRVNSRDRSGSGHVGGR